MPNRKKSQWRLIKWDTSRPPVPLDASNVSDRRSRIIFHSLVIGIFKSTTNYGERYAREQSEEPVVCSSRVDAFRANYRTAGATGPTGGKRDGRRMNPPPGGGEGSGSFPVDWYDT